MAIFNSYVNLPEGTIRSLEDGLKAEAREGLTRLSGIKGDGPQVRCCPLEIEYECKIDNVVNPIVNYNQLHILYNPSMYMTLIDREGERERESERERQRVVFFFMHRKAILPM